MLTGAGLGDDPGLAHAPGQQRLADGVVDLVRAGVIEVLAFQVDLGTTQLTTQPLGMIDRRRSADVVLKIGIQLCLEGRILHVFFIRHPQFIERLHQRFGDEYPTIGSEMTFRIRQIGQTGLIVLHFAPLQ